MNIKLFQCNWKYNIYGKRGKSTRRFSELARESTIIMMITKLTKVRTTTKNTKSIKENTNRNPLITQWCNSFESAKLPYLLIFFNISIAFK